MNEENKNVVSVALKAATKPGTLAGLKHSQVQQVIEGMRMQIGQALPKHLTADRMIQMATNLIVRNPKLAECSAASLVGAVMQASILGFRPVESLGECHFVPYAGHVQFQIGYKGYISLSRRSGELLTAYAEVVREKDEFQYEVGLEPKLIHKPALDDAGQMTHVYAVAKYKDGGYNFIVLTRAEVNHLRLKNPSQKNGISGAWATDFDSMAKAKAIKQLAKYMPLSVDLQNAILSDEGVITEKAFTNDHSGIMVEEIQYTPEIPDTPAAVPPTGKKKEPTPPAQPEPSAEPDPIQDASVMDGIPEIFGNQEGIV